MTFIPGSVPDLAADWLALGVTLFTLAALVWGAVWKGTAPLRSRLDAVRDLADTMRRERERVDDLTEQVQQIERRLEALERRVEDVYHLLVSLIDPRRRMRRPPLDDGPADDAAAG